MPTPIEETVDIGKELARRLRAVGIEAQEQLMRLGRATAFAKLTRKLRRGRLAKLPTTELAKGLLG